MVPFGKYHAGKKRLKTAIIAAIIWILMYVIVFCIFCFAK